MCVWYCIVAGMLQFIFKSRVKKSRGWIFVSLVAVSHIVAISKRALRYLCSIACRCRSDWVYDSDGEMTIQVHLEGDIGVYVDLNRESMCIGIYYRDRRVAIS
jgi:hypothetical protein